MRLKRFIEHHLLLQVSQLVAAYNKKYNHDYYKINTYMKGIQALNQTGLNGCNPVKDRELIAANTGSARIFSIVLFFNTPVPGFTTVNHSGLYSKTR
jgi:hypothetical protein